MRNGFLDTKDFWKAASFCGYAALHFETGYNSLLASVTSLLCIYEITPNSEVII